MEKRSIIHVLGLNSNLTQEHIDKIFTEESIYTNQNTIQKYVNWFLLGSGVAFVLAGIIFFFAFNWAVMHKFAKFGTLEFLVIASCLFSVFYKKNQLIKDVSITASSILMGTLFLQFGQIYQTGANAYDLFLIWTLAISLWTFSSNFSVQWLLYLLVLNTTISLYFQQGLDSENYSLHMMVMFAINLTAYILWRKAQKKNIIQDKSTWFPQLIIMGASSILTLNTMTMIFQGFHGLSFGIVHYISILTAALFFPFSTVHAIDNKNIIFYGFSFLCLNAIGLTFLLNIIPSDPALSAFLAFIYETGAIVTTIKFVLKYQREWNEEE